ncbi:Fur family peroxide stress response transcriptional regulator [Tumebacillus sp. BK434]|uniref:Fur family transcriptional regulator n=1 Tax=Tumebacillus sp. BK434 TaxID=2512169 RepID=UPI00105316E7|nr:Fur family transcriptional regulator [Tumebacillus sp. BK434]TCP54698.1 Fur family peroxide stress response transcriptional regulator [Tumebacillus sp. BK434]
MKRKSYSQSLADLKGRGIRLTPQRQIILQYLKETEEHPTAEQVYHKIGEQFPGISLATVYNTLNMLKELGVIRELSYGDVSSRYDGNDSEHAHLVCEHCAQVLDIASPPEEAVLTKNVQQAGFTVSSYRLEYYGTCASCAQSAPYQKDHAS